MQFVCPCLIAHSTSRMPPPQGQGMCPSCSLLDPCPFIQNVFVECLLYIRNYAHSRHSKVFLVERREWEEGTFTHTHTHTRSSVVSDQKIFYKTNINANTDFICILLKLDLMWYQEIAQSQKYENQATNTILPLISCVILNMWPFWNSALLG